MNPAFRSTTFAELALAERLYLRSRTKLRRRQQFPPDFRNAAWWVAGVILASMARRLHFAATVACAVLGLAFVGLWVRSHYRVDTIIGPIGGTSTFGWGSVNGIFACGVSGVTSPPTEWAVKSHLARPRTASRWQRGVLFGLGFSFTNDSTGVQFQLPYWFLVASSLGFAALFACKRNLRFSVRGLLIATTLLAAVLGLVVYTV